MDLFDLLEDINKVEDKNTDNCKLIKIYNEEDIKKSNIKRCEYIRSNSYVGSKMNTDLRGIKYIDTIQVEKEATDEIAISEETSEAKIPNFKNSQSNIKYDNRFLIVDGSSLLSTSFYATARDLLFSKTDEQKELAYTKLMQTKEGIYTNGVYMFFKSLLSLIERQNITHLAVVLDRSRNTFRREISADYKANRKDTPRPLKDQFGLIGKILREMNIPTFSNLEFEADDFAGSISKKFENEIPIVLHTKDEDYIQLVTDKTKLWMVTSKSDDMYKELNLNRDDLGVPQGVFEYTPEYVKYFKGIDPIQIIDAKAIEGDKSDNIKGVKNVGETSSRPLLREYKTVEGIYEAIEGLDDKEIKNLNLYFKENLGIKRSPIKNLISYKEDAFISKKLATIKTDIEEIQDLTLDDFILNVNILKMTDTFKELQMNSLLKLIPKSFEENNPFKEEKAWCPF